MSISPNIAERFVDGKGAIGMDGKSAGAGKFSSLHFAGSRLVVFGVESARGRLARGQAYRVPRVIHEKTLESFSWWKEDVDVRRVGAGSGPNCSFLIVGGVENLFCVG